MSKKPARNNTKSIKKKEQFKEVLHASKGKTILTSSLVIVVLAFLYSNYFPPTMLIYRDVLQSSTNEIQPLHGKVSIPFTAKANYLDDVYFRLSYVDPYVRPGEDNPKNAILHFKLLDAHGKPLAYFSKRAYDVSTTPFLKFNLPVIADSSYKKYIFEISLEGGSTYDQIFIDASGMTSIYQYIHTPVSLVTNRLLYVFSNPNFVFAFIFILFITTAYLIRQNRRNDL